jgi:hypothetical protein
MRLSILRVRLRLRQLQTSAASVEASSCLAAGESRFFCKLVASPAYSAVHIVSVLSQRDRSVLMELLTTFRTARTGFCEGQRPSESFLLLVLSCSIVAVGLEDHRAQLSRDFVVCESVLAESLICAESVGTEPGLRARGCSR